MVAESWFRSLWRTSKKHEFNSGRVQIEVLAFEAASLMSKLLHLWHSLTDRQVAKLREEISNSVGIKRLISDSDDYIVKLICEEMTENLAKVARAMARLSKKCNDPLLKSFEQAFVDLTKFGSDTYMWQFSWKKMDRKAKKMERLIIANTNLYQDMETLADLEQTLKRMKKNENADIITLVEYEKKVACKKQEVKHLKEISLWNRTYDYTILLLARSLFTIYGRIGHVFGVNHVAADVGVRDSRLTDINIKVYPSEEYVPRFSSGGKSISVSGPLPRTTNMGRSQSTTSSPISGKHDGISFYSGPLGRSTEKSGPISRASKNTFRFWFAKEKKVLHRNPTSRPYTRRMTGPLGNEAECASTKPHAYGISIVASKKTFLNAPPETLGAAALSLHYANVIIFIEKLVASPHLIGNDARNDLYNMLPASIRAALRTKLKPYAKVLSSSVYDTALAGEWNEAMLSTLEWLAPLAHNMIRWQSERSFEHQNLFSRTNVLLAQTLYFANQEKTEEAITEILVGLNYIWRFGREINAKSLVECTSGRTFNEYLD